MDPADDSRSGGGSLATWANDDRVEALEDPEPGDMVNGALAIHGALIVDVLANDGGESGRGLRSVSGQQMGAKTTIVDGRIRYEPPRDWFGRDTLRYAATDGLSVSTANVFIDLKNKPDAPRLVEGALLWQGVLVLDSRDGAESFSLREAFEDVDGDSLFYEASTDNATVLSATVAGSILVVLPLKSGTAGVVVVASDAVFRVQGTVQFEVKRGNAAPRILWPLQPMSVRVDEVVQVDASGHFVDDDEDMLSFHWHSSNESVATVSSDGSVGTITGKSSGVAEITVTASDALSETEGTFSVTVAGARISVSPSSLSFGTVQVGEYKDLALTVKNDGSATLTGTISAGTAGFESGGYSIQSGGGEFSLSPGEGLDVELRLAPLSIGSSGSSLTIVHNDASVENPVVVPLYGEAAESESIVNSIGMRFRRIRAGSFLMGSSSGYSNERPVHSVMISRDFLIGDFEVTQGQWVEVMGTNPSHFTSCGRDCPVERVSWEDVQEFIRKLNEREGVTSYRLPTEAEWEYAARAGTTTDYSFGENYPPTRLSDYAWHCSSNDYPACTDNSRSTTHSVGGKLPNPWGLYDMHGNVWEWVGDRYGPYSAGSATDPGGPKSGSTRVYRGSGWDGLATMLRSSHRNHAAEDFRRYYVGFRIVRSLN